MKDRIKGIMDAYFELMKLFFYIFLFATLSFGRAFSILHINTPLGHLFITEIFLLLNIPILIRNYKALAKLPRIFLAIFLIYLTGSFCYLFAGIFAQNMFALRDIVISAYLLFFPLTFIYLNNLKSFKFLILIIILSNMVNLFSGQCLMLDAYPSEIFRNFIINSKLFNLGLYYGIMSAFIISYYERIKPKTYRILALIILSLNVFMLMTIALTSLWVATLALFLFLLWMLKGKFLKLLIFFVPVFIFTSSVIYYLDFKKTAKPHNKASVINELKGLRLFISQAPSQYELEEPVPGEVVKLAEVSVQDKSVVPLSQPKIGLDNVSGQKKIVKTYPGEEVSKKNMNWRLGIWSQTLRFAWDSPWFGKGFGVYPVYKIGPSRQHPRSIYFDPWMVPVHNDLVTVFFKMGILGLGLYLFINIYVFSYAFSYIKECKLKFVNNSIVALLGALVFWHALALFFDVIDSPPTSIFLWIIMGMIFAVVEIDKKERGQLG